MTPKELYEISTDQVGPLTYLKESNYDHIPEAIVDQWDLIDIKSDLITIKIVKEFYFDARRFWRLCTVWYDNKPFMIIQNAGREGDDHSERIITNADLYNTACVHIRKLIRVSVNDISIVDENSNLNNLISFYGSSLTGDFERY